MGCTVSSFRTLLEYLAAYSQVEMVPKSHPEHSLILCIEPMSIQIKSYELLKLYPRELVPMKLTI